MRPGPAAAPLDEVDRAILQLLQRDARNLTAVDIAGTVGVSDGTVRNRIEKLEAKDVIEGYVPMVDYELAGYPLQIRIVCTAPIVERAELAREALNVEGVVEVHEVMTGRRNVEVKAVAARHDDVTRVALALDEMGLAVDSEELIRHHYLRPFDHFGTEAVDDGDEAATVYDLGPGAR